MSTKFYFPSNSGLDGTIDTVEIHDAAGDPTQVLALATDYEVEVKWTVSGAAVPFVGGDWSAQLYVESIGQGYEGDLGVSVTVPLNGGKSYTAKLTIPANVLTPPPPGEQLVYKLVALLSHTINGNKTIIAGFGEGPYFEVR